MITGALNWRTTTANQVFQNASKVYSLSVDRVLDLELLNEIKHKNYSRIPIYSGEKSKNLIIGVLLVKSLIGISFEKGESIGSLITSKQIKIVEPLYVKPIAPVENILQLFKKGSVH